MDSRYSRQVTLPGFGASAQQRLTAARVLGMDHRLGRVAPGYDAGLGLLDAGGGVGRPVCLLMRLGHRVKSRCLLGCLVP